MKKPKATRPSGFAVRQAPSAALALSRHQKEGSQHRGHIDKAAKSAALYDTDASNEGQGEVDYNIHTGRPIRKSAGKRDFGENIHVNSTALELLSGPSSGDDSPGPSKEKGPGKRVKRSKHLSKKRKPVKQSPSPEPLSDSASAFTDDANSVAGEYDDDGKVIHKRREPISLQYDIPEDHRGFFTIRLDLDELVKKYGENKTAPRAKPIVPSSQAARLNASALLRRRDGSFKTGFMSLPPELRNTVYQLVFIRKDPLDFKDRYNLCLSGGFLSTCKQVEREGTTVLYGENTFYFQRIHAQRGRFFDRVWKEIGYEDMRRFLARIGRRNFSCIRSMVILLEDGMPSIARTLTPTERRVVNDNHLSYCISKLARCGNLKRLEVGYFGRRQLCRYDGIIDKLICFSNLQHFAFINHPRWSTYESKVDSMERDWITYWVMSPEAYRQPAKNSGSYVSPMLVYRG
ncbi:MAG: hypothetical protein M1833_005694 [Piccolia ochrophora]|nr:MAG: hypothetical protein M1833_005694 [Piccolia ochrophora]